MKKNLNCACFIAYTANPKIKNLSVCIETRHVTSRKHVNNFLTVAQTQDVLMRNWTVGENILNDRMENKGIRKQSKRKKRERGGRRYEYENSNKSTKLHILHGRGHLE